MYRKLNSMKPAMVPANRDKAQNVTPGVRDDVKRLQAALYALAQSEAVLKMKPMSVENLEALVRSVTTEGFFGVVEMGVSPNTSHPVDVRWHGGAKLN